VGNYFNQEAFGKPTTLPWGLKVDPAYRPAGYSQYETFHPTFLYEGLWNLIGCGLILWAERRFKLQHGKVIMLYVMWYSFGRFFIELIRIDPVTMILGVRINDWTDGIIFLAAVAVFVLLMKRYPTSVDEPLAGMGEKWRAKTVEQASVDNTDAADIEAKDAVNHPAPDTAEEAVDETTDLAKEEEPKP